MLGHMSLKLSLLQKLMPSLSPLPQRWPMALLHILLKWQRSNWKTILRPMHGAPLPMYWFSTLRFCYFSGNVYVTFLQTKIMFFFSREHYLKICIPSFDMILILILILHWSTGSMVPPSQWCFLEEELIEHKLLPINEMIFNWFF